MSVALATRGMIRSCCQQGGIVCGEGPEMQAVLEVRPRIRYVAAPTTATVTGPVMTSAQELKPETEATGTGPADPNPKPTQTATVELRPIIKRVEED